MLVSGLRPRTLVELGAGSAAKTRILLDAMRDAGCLEEYVPVDVSEEFLLETARRSAHELITPVIEAGFPERTVQPYGVAAVVYVMDRLHIATGESAYARWREHARAWFDGRNTAGRPVYDRVAGRVHDGVDDGVVNPHSGAESNIVAAQALFPEIARRASELLDEVPELVTLETELA